MDWFRVDSDLPRHPHLLRVARRLSITKTQAMGHLLALWCAVAEHAENGDLRAVDDELVELYAEWPDSRRGEFVAALNEVGWIDTKRQLSGWAKRHEYMLRERKRKIDERRNWRKSKGKRIRTVRAPSADGCAHHPADGARCPPPDGAQPTVPNRTVPDRTQEVLKDIAPAHPPESFPADVRRLYAVYLEATARPVHPPTEAEGARLAEMIAWAGSLEAAERGVRKVGASDWHRGVNPTKRRHDSLLRGRPFACKAQFAEWCEEPSPSTPRPVGSRSLLDDMIDSAVSNVRRQA